MPKGIKKTTTATLRADIDKQMATIKAKEIALAKAKDDYDKKVRQERPLTWVNDAELNKISTLNTALNKGETLNSMRRRFTELTKRKISFSDLPAIFFSVKYRIFPLIFSQTMRNIVSRQQTNGTTATGQPLRSGCPERNRARKGENHNEG